MLADEHFLYACKYLHRYDNLHKLHVETATKVSKQQQTAKVHWNLNPNFRTKRICIRNFLGKWNQSDRTGNLTNTVNTIGGDANLCEVPMFNYISAGEPSAITS